MKRRLVLGGLIAAPLIVRTTGLLMPVRPVIQKVTLHFRVERVAQPDRTFILVAAYEEPSRHAVLQNTALKIEGQRPMPVWGLLPEHLGEAQHGKILVG